MTDWDVVLSRIWTEAALAVRIRKIQQREKVIARAVALQKKEAEDVDLLRRRSQNSRRPVTRLPIEVLVRIFSNVNPGAHRSPTQWVPNLAGVCHRWLSIANGPAGASLWTHVLVSFRKARDLSSSARDVLTALSRSGSLPLAVRVASYFDTGLSVEAGSAAQVLGFLAAEQHRYRSLDVWNAGALKYMFPVRGHFERLVEMDLSFPHTRQGWDSNPGLHPSLFRGAEFPSLRKLILAGFFDEESAGKLFESLSPVSRCTVLKINRLACTLSTFCVLLHRFPNLEHLDMDGRLSDGPDSHIMPVSPNLTVPLPYLETIKCTGDKRPAILRRITAPALKAIAVESIGPSSEPPLIFPPNDYPVLDSLTFNNLSANEINLSEMVFLRGSVSHVNYRYELTGLVDALQQLITHMIRPSLTPARAEEHVVGTFHAPRVLSLSNWDDEGEPSLDDENDGDEYLVDRENLIETLEVLANIRNRHEWVHGRGLRICLDESYLFEHPRVAEVVSRYPDFLGSCPPYSFD